MAAIESFELKREGLLDGQAIQVSTIPAAKGLEFDHVVVLDVNIHEFDGRHSDDRNLFYVASSRARRMLTLTHRPEAASPFVACALDAMRTYELRQSDVDEPH